LTAIVEFYNTDSVDFFADANKPMFGNDYGLCGVSSFVYGY